MFATASPASPGSTKAEAPSDNASHPGTQQPHATPPASGDLEATRSAEYFTSSILSSVFATASLAPPGSTKAEAQSDNAPPPGTHQPPETPSASGVTDTTHPAEYFTFFLSSVNVSTSPEPHDGSSSAEAGQLGDVGLSPAAVLPAEDLIMETPIAEIFASEPSTTEKAAAAEGKEETADGEMRPVAGAEALEDRAAALALSQTTRGIMGGDSGFGSSPCLGDDQDDGLVDAFMGDYGQCPHAPSSGTCLS